jgi:hypothetical protein
MARQKAASKAESPDAGECEVLEPITPAQQLLIEALLSGKSVTVAALSTGVSRRAAVYWLHTPGHPVRREYEKQRVNSQVLLASRVAGLHEAAFKALEDLLLPTAPASVRFQAAKLIYEAHLKDLCEVTPPQLSFDLIDSETDQMWKNRERQGHNAVMLYDDRNRERFPEDD